MSELTIEVEQRAETGKNANRRLRVAGGIPAVVYGGGKDPVPIRVERRTLQDLLRGGGGEHKVFLLKLKGTGKSRHAMIRELQVDPVTRAVVHVDFQRIVMTEKVRVEIPVELSGTPTGVKNEGGILDFVTRQVEVECLPANIPEKLLVDVSDLHVGQHVEVRQLQVPPEVAVLEELGRVVASVAHARVAEVEPEEGAEELLEAEREEPEVIRRGRVVEEEGEEPEREEK